ncbi:xylulokinase [Aquibacillus koreensis]|uniref:Xylulose kinase n=1 Tax=Aquibacillus koreensis TaxID=279446 RepID=A0A9X4ALC7_9BACI|nr:xylulokinase [Aquibacillus koreensis]MCT2537026.1 xylulokinase [Aquibacillus koreensis]MDC3422320.1 xylulokinase [Aquibacillus koreensis]
MKYVIGVDLGTSAVKLLLVNQKGEVAHEVSKEYPLIHEKTGYSEQDPEEWVKQTTAGLAELVSTANVDVDAIEGMSFSGQMHGLVLLDENNEVLRNAILWNDTRTTPQCAEIYEKVGKEKFIGITKNLALEGFTLPKILWVKENEPDLYAQAKTFVLPKDYLRYRITGELQMEYSDAAGTSLLDISAKDWSKEICEILDIDISICPPLVNSHDNVGNITADFAKATGLAGTTDVFAGGADNACGAIGSGILSPGKTFASIGTSGVVLSYEETGDKDYEGKVHYFNHAAPNAYYTMGVTLSAGHSLNWFKSTFAPEEDFATLLQDVGTVPVGSNGLLFTPYLVGERTPHADATIRGSFIGMDSSHKRKHFARAVLEGITFSLNESIDIFRENGKTIDTVYSIGGGAKNEDWLQMQADIFNAKIVKLTSEQGPGMGAAMLAAFGSGWFSTLEECADAFLAEAESYEPIPENAETYAKLFKVYKDVYTQTSSLNKQLMDFRS